MWSDSELWAAAMLQEPVASAALMAKERNKIPKW